MIHIHISFYVPKENRKKFFRGGLLSDGLYTRLNIIFALSKYVHNGSPIHGTAKQPDGSYHVYYNLLANSIKEWEIFDQEKDWNKLHDSLLCTVEDLSIDVKK